PAPDAPARPPAPALLGAVHAEGRRVRAVGMAAARRRGDPPAARPARTAPRGMVRRHRRRRDRRPGVAMVPPAPDRRVRVLPAAAGRDPTARYPPSGSRALRGL